MGATGSPVVKLGDIGLAKKLPVEVVALRSPRYVYPITG
jgi:hypothetical protein